MSIKKTTNLMTQITAAKYTTGKTIPSMNHSTTCL